MPWKITGTIVDPDGTPSDGAIVAIVSPTPARSTSGKLIDNDRVAIPVSGGQVDDVALESVPGATWTFLLPRRQRVEIADPGDGSVIDLAADVSTVRPLAPDEASLLREEIKRLQAEGLRGDPGPANTLSIGSVTSGPTASASIRGASPDQILDLVLPKSDGGGSGTSSPGPANVLTIGSVTSGAQAAASITGTSPSQVLNLTLPKGDPGPPGKDGASPPAPVFTASASTLSAGAAATAAVSGTYPNLELTFGIPRGADGAGGSGTGQTAYEMRGTGSPYGVVTPPAAGTYYTDTAGTTGAWRWIATGTDRYSWVVVHGDTGRRDLSDSVVGLSAGRIYVRRVNNWVTVDADDARWGNLTSGSPTIPLSSGFGPSPTYVGAMFALGGSGGPTDLGLSRIDKIVEGLRFRDAGKDLRLRDTRTWSTLDLWPSSLPGTPA